MEVPRTSLLAYVRWCTWCYKVLFLLSTSRHPSTGLDGVAFIDGHHLNIGYWNDCDRPSPQIGLPKGDLCCSTGTLRSSDFNLAHVLATKVQDAAT